jgi:two-component system response regulator AtoC
MRELKNVLERALVFHAPTEIQPQHLELDPVIESAPYRPSAAHHHDDEIMGNGHDHGGPSPMVLPEQGINLEDLERDLLLQALERARNNQTKAAELLGISRHTFRYRLEKYGIIKH